jgi:hypothetical protein
MLAKDWPTVWPSFSFAKSVRMCLVTGSFRSAWIAGGLFGIRGSGRWRLGGPAATCDREERLKKTIGSSREQAEARSTAVQ